MTTAIVPTIENHTNGLIVTSETIAQGAGVEHRAVLQLVDKYRTELDSLNPTAFEMRKGAALEHGGFAKATRTALLNEPQSSLLMMFMRNTAQVVAFKLALVTAFYEMRNLIESPIIQEALFGMEHEGFMLGQPVRQLPALPSKNGQRWVSPSQERNDRLAAIVKSTNGAWVPVTIDGFTDKQHIQLGYGIRYGKRASFPKGQYDTAIRDNTLYIRHNTKEITA